MKSEEIAKLAGVSRSTVSRVVNNYANVPGETRRRVMEIVNRCDYRPNSAARRLAGSPLNTIGLFAVGAPARDPGQSAPGERPPTALMQAVVDALSARGYFALVRLLRCEGDFEAMRQALRQRRIGGVILAGAELEAGAFADILGFGCPVAAIGVDPAKAGRPGGRAGITVVNAMDYEGAGEAVGYLAGLGHSDIGLLGGRADTFAHRERRRAYADAMKARGLPICELGSLRGALPEALYCADDGIALSAMRALQSRGVRVPEDVSIAGFGDIAAARHASPPLTTVRTPALDMAEMAVESVASGLRGGQASFSLVSLPARLIIRNSCAEAGRAAGQDPHHHKTDRQEDEDELRIF